MAYAVSDEQIEKLLRDWKPLYSYLANLEKPEIGNDFFEKTGFWDMDNVRSQAGKDLEKFIVYHLERKE